MAKTKFFYLILIVISVLFYFLYIGDLSLYLMIFIISFPVLLKIIMLITKFNIKINIYPASDTTLKNGKCKYNLTIKNRTIFPFSNSKIKIEYKNKLSDITNYMDISVPVHPLTEEKLTFYLSSDYCGILSIKIKSFIIYDYIKLFKCRIKSVDAADVYILPDFDTDCISHHSKLLENEDSEAYSKNKSGDDPSEIYDLKNYIPGDKLNRIHWNLSFIQNKIITKHFSQPVNSSIIVIPDLIKKDSIYSVDTALEILYAVSMNMLNNDISFNLCLYNNKSGENENINISDEEELISCMVTVIQNILHDNTNLISDNISDICSNQSEIFLITNKSIKINELNIFNSESEKTLIFVDDNFPKSQFKYYDNLTLAEIPSGKFYENIEKILN